ncbi:MAG: hypothetical protein M3Z05_04735 [Gemmatimonadota bacterium]|nr:hypothetical protein [Gemmatimonadota bacterium]
MINPMRLPCFALAAAALLAGCGADSSVSTTSTPADLSEVFREMSLPAITGATSAAAGYEGPTASLGSGIPSGCTYALTSQSFVCAPITASGLTITQSYQLLNSSGSALSSFEPTSLSAVRMQGTIAGSDTSAGDTFTITGSQDQTLSGLQTSKHTLNGTSTMNISGTFGTGTATAEPLTLETKSTTKDLVIPAHAAANSYPVSGTITIVETMPLRGLPAFTTTMVLTFNGTSKVKVTVDGIAVPGCSTIDLASTNPGCS